MADTSSCSAIATRLFLLHYTASPNKEPSSRVRDDLSRLVCILHTPCSRLSLTRYQRILTCPHHNPLPNSLSRDVLQQIDHRLSLIETDVRENNTKIENKIDALEAKTESRFNALETKFEDRINALDHKVEGKLDGLDNKIEVETREIRRDSTRNGKFNLVIGLVITTWLSMMGTLFFKL